MSWTNLRRDKKGRWRRKSQVWINGLRLTALGVVIVICASIFYWGVSDPIQNWMSGLSLGWFVLIIALAGIVGVILADRWRDDSARRNGP